MGAGESPAPDRLIAATATAVALTDTLNAQSAVVLDYGVQTAAIHQSVSLRICESVCSGTRSCSGAYIDVLRHRRSVDILPTLARVALLCEVARHEFDCLGVAVRGILGSAHTCFRRLIYAPCGEEYADESRTSKTGTQSDTRCSHAATAVAIAAVTFIISVAATAALQRKDVRDRKILHCSFVFPAL